MATGISERPDMRLGWHRVSALLGAGFLLAFALCVLLARYYRFYHLATPGTGAGLLVIALPASALLATALSLGTAGVLARRGVGPAAATWTGLGAAACVLGLLFAAEVVRTTPARSGEGPGAGDLAPFWASLVGGGDH